MKVLIIPDKFKYTFSSKEIGEIIANVIKKYHKDAEPLVLPVSDGGEGFLDLINNVYHCQTVVHQGVDALQRPVETSFLLCGSRIYIECAKTCGLYHLQENERNPLIATTKGLGVQIKDTLKYCPSDVYVGLGGSATNDLGIGMAEILGVNFFDKQGQRVEALAKNMLKISRIEGRLDFDTRFFAITDVNNVLYGKNGASFNYARQKGADGEQIKQLDEGIKHLSNLIKKYYNIDLQKIRGTGAAGGLAGGFVAFLNAKIISGSNFVFNELDLENKIKNSDIIITGEGSFDYQSFSGKLTGKIIETAKKYNKKIVLICGINKTKAYDFVYPLFASYPGKDIAKRQTPQKIEKIIKQVLG